MLIIAFEASKIKSGSFFPVRDGFYIKEDALKLLKEGRADSIPVMIGSTAEEATGFITDKNINAK